MKRRDFLQRTALLILADRLGRRVHAASDSNDGFLAAASKDREFLVNFLDPTLGLLPEYRRAKVYWLYHDNYVAAKTLRASHPQLSGRIEKAIKYVEKLK
jgi:hypothetical protein